MKILMAPGAFKGCLAAAEVAESISVDVRSVFPVAEVGIVPPAGMACALVARLARKRGVGACTGSIGDGAALVPEEGGAPIFPSFPAPCRSRRRLGKHLDSSGPRSSRR